MRHMESQQQNDVAKHLVKARKIARNTLYHVTHTTCGVKWYPPTPADSKGERVRA